jgi:hypothetical protein
MHALIAWLALARDVCILRRGPQDIPHAPGLLGFLIVLTLAVNLALQAVAGLGAFNSAPHAIYVLVAVGLLYSLLRVADKHARFVQTASAWMATHIVFAALSLPIVLHAKDVLDETKTASPLLLALRVLALVLLIWQFVVRGHILRHALDVPMRLGVLLGVVTYALEYGVTMVLSAQWR